MRRTLALLITPALALLSACAAPDASNTPVVQTAFVPSASLRLATIDRDTGYALVRRDGRDVLVLEDTGYGRHGLPETRRTWIVELPASTPAGTTLRFDRDDDRVTAWLLESGVGMDTHAAGVGGSVRIDGRTESGLEATVVLRTEPTPYRPGQTAPEPVSVTRRALWEARDIDTGLAPELEDDGA